MSQNHVTEYFCQAKEHGIQWQLNRSYCLTCTPGHVAAQFDHHGNTVVLGKFQAACVSEITVELTNYFLALYCGCFMFCDVKRSCCIVVHHVKVGIHVDAMEVLYSPTLGQGGGDKVCVHVV